MTISPLHILTLQPSSPKIPTTILPPSLLFVFQTYNQYPILTLAHGWNYFFFFKIQDPGSGHCIPPFLLLEMISQFAFFTLRQAQFFSSWQLLLHEFGYTRRLCVTYEVNKAKFIGGPKVTAVISNALKVMSLK